jgi:protein-arginine kinase activator protein McsA
MESSLICKACSNKIALGDIRSDKSGSGWVCIQCYEGQHPDIYKMKSVSEEKNPLARSDQITSQLKKVKYYCSECGYKFETEGEYSRKCPYCNLYAVKEDKDAETILQETMRENFTAPSPKTELKNKDPKIEIVDD